MRASTNVWGEHKNHKNQKNTAIPGITSILEGHVFLFFRFVFFICILLKVHIYSEHRQNDTRLMNEGHVAVVADDEHILWQWESIATDWLKWLHDSYWLCNCVCLLPFLPFLLLHWRSRAACDLLAITSCISAGFCCASRDLSVISSGSASARFYWHCCGKGKRNWWLKK